MKYFVTYCAMDHRLANPFWHACLVLSQAPALGEKIEVKHAWGFYPTTMSNPDSLLNKLKKALGFNFDLNGNFGVLKKEEMRYLDLGYGLHGVTFEIEEAQFRELKQLCKEKISNQELAINEARQALRLASHESASMEIFEEEKRSALAEGRKPRLNPFDFRVSLGVDGFSLKESYTCKTLAVELLSLIGIPQYLLDKITLQNTSIALPRYSGQLEEIFFHSEGPWHRHRSERSGNITFFREWADKQNKLYWSFPPQYIDSKNQNHVYALPEKLTLAVKKCLSRLQQIEHAVVNAKIHGAYEYPRQELLQYVCQLYQTFSIMHAEQQGASLRDVLYKANYFMNCLVFAINDDWDDLDEVETIASKFDEQTQRKICNIVGKSYARPEKNDESRIGRGCISQS